MEIYNYIVDAVFIGVIGWLFGKFVYYTSKGYTSDKYQKYIDFHIVMLIRVVFVIIFWYVITRV